MTRVSKLGSTPHPLGARMSIAVYAMLCMFALLGCELPEDPTGEGGKLAKTESVSAAGNNKINDYDEARQVFWGSLYKHGGATLYCDQKFKSSRRNGLNIEHVFPMSWVTKPLACGTRKQCRRTSRQFNRIEADLHNLFPSRTEVNAARSSFRFAEIRGEERHFGQRCDFEVNSSMRAAEPRPAVRGDIARAIFYLAH